MRIPWNKQTIAQAALTIALLAMLGVAVVNKPPPGDAPRGGLAERWLPSFTSDDGEAAAADRWADLRTMPAYRDAERSITELDGARASLLKAAAAGDGAAVFSAGADYHRTLERVRGHLATLETYVDPAEYGRCLRALFLPDCEAHLGGAAIQESLLGILPRVSVLSEENQP